MFLALRSSIRISSASLSQSVTACSTCRAFATDAKADKKPKRGASGFALFLKENFNTYKGTGSSTVSDATKKIGAAWKALTVEQKAPYITKSKSSQEAANKEILKWKELNVVKRPLSGFLRFATEFRKKGDYKGREGAVQATKDAAAAWKALSEDKKATYNSAAEKDKAAYNNNPIVLRHRIEKKEKGRMKAIKKRAVAAKERRAEMRAQGIPVRRKKVLKKKPTKKKLTKKASTKTTKKSSKKKGSMKSSKKRGSMKSSKKASKKASKKVSKVSKKGSKKSSKKGSKKSSMK